MTKLLDRAVEAARNLPSDAQDDIARIVLQLAGDQEATISLSAAERSAIEKSKVAAERGEFATDEQVQAAWPLTFPLPLRERVPERSEGG